MFRVPHMYIANRVGAYAAQMNSRLCSPPAKSGPEEGVGLAVGWPSRMISRGAVGELGNAVQLSVPYDIPSRLERYGSLYGLLYEQLLCHLTFHGWRRLYFCDQRRLDGNAYSVPYGQAGRHGSVAEHGSKSAPYIFLGTMPATSQTVVGAFRFRT